MKKKHAFELKIRRRSITKSAVLEAGRNPFPAGPVWIAGENRLDLGAWCHATCTNSQNLVSDLYQPVQLEQTIPVYPR